MASDLLSRNIIRYAITNRSQYGATESIREMGLLRQTEDLARLGVDFIQLREKDLGAVELTRLARRMLDVLHRANSGTRLLINSGADIAAATGADGVHLTSGEGELTPEQARRVLRLNGAMISVSCHRLADVERARENAADMILFGPVYEKSIAGKVIVPGTGLAALAKACGAAGTVPVLALGGMTRESIDACIEAGAKGVAGIRLFQRLTNESKCRFSLGVTNKKADSLLE